MKFSYNKDVDLPIDRVFSGLSDFDYYERQILRRGVKLERLDDGQAAGMGVKWRAKADFRGRTKTLVSEVTAFHPVEGFEITTDAGGVTAFTSIDLTQLAVERTRITVGLDLRPESLSGRLFIQSLKFAKGNLTNRFKKRIDTLAADLVTRNAQF